MKKDNTCGIKISCGVDIEEISRFEKMASKKENSTTKHNLLEIKSSWAE
jgi:phosphopantetheinyl transferase (holo-ACP synthase)